MIQNEQQYYATEKELRRLRNIKLKGWPADKILQCYGIESLECSIETLQCQLKHYRELYSARAKVDLSVIETVPELLILARITAGLSQRNLAVLMDTSRQQISRLERTQYQSASLKFITRVKNVLEDANSIERSLLSALLTEGRKQKREP